MFHKLAFCVCFLPILAFAADPAPVHHDMTALVDSHAAEYRDLSRKVWEFAEVGYQEHRSSALLQQHLKEAGFTVQAGVADIPTAFVATYGQGKPVIGILGEFDALPGLSQGAVPERNVLVAGAPGHGCGHNLLGAGGALAAVAVKGYMVSHHVAGTLRFYGTPAEEGGSGKVYMIRAGLFKDVDVVLHWHPGDRNSVTGDGMLAVISAKFEFHGLAAHAAAAPEMGRSALDGVMLMGNAVEFMREHVPSVTRIHYIISKGGTAPNVVPDDAEIFLYARHPSMPALTGIWDRIVACAKGAAMATGTTVDVHIISSDYNLIGNTPLAERMHQNLTELGGIAYTPAEADFAARLTPLLPPGSRPRPGAESRIEPLRRDASTEGGSASSDVGDVSWTVPTMGLSAATWVPGTPAHSWYAVAASGMSIGQDGMVLAAKTIAVTAQDLFADPQLREAAKVDFERRLEGLHYQSQIPADQKPPLDYRKLGN